ncbi:type IIL restriction-modification enzyme MmeI [Nannocystis pusilla]|uniref:type IIL restriction-modification enzyme MmeI n=1 Tax=Nannocystis pusilla TaxID=889268 RepID=UPI003B780314
MFALADDYSFGVLQSALHWQWFTARCSTLKRDYRYTSSTVWARSPGRRPRPPRRSNKSPRLRACCDRSAPPRWSATTPRAASCIEASTHPAALRCATPTRPSTKQCAPPTTAAASHCASSSTSTSSSPSRSARAVRSSAPASPLWPRAPSYRPPAPRPTASPRPERCASSGRRPLRPLSRGATSSCPCGPTRTTRRT